MAKIQNGVLPKSKMFFCSFSQNKSLFYYPLSVGHFYCNNDYSIKRDSFDSYLLSFIVRGSFTFESEGKSYTAKSGDIAIVNCFMPHAYYADDSFEAYWLHINGSNTRSLFSELVNKKSCIIKSTDLTEEKIKSIYTLIKTKAMIEESQLSSMIYSLICELFASVTTDKASNNTISKAVEYIGENFNRELKIDEIAAAFGLSSSQFSRKFKKQIGTSPYDYLLSVRLTRAKELLKNSSLSISEISDKCGFNGYSNFIYFFTKEEGISPLKFRNTLY